MRKSVAKQLELVVRIANHPHASELREMGLILDKCPEAAELVLSDLLAGGIDPTQGCAGLTGEQVLRAALVKQMNRYSYEQLAFHLADSQSYRAFCRLGIAQNWISASALQFNIKKVRAETFEAINKMLVGYARAQKLEDGKKTRTDCTVTDSNIHAPTDSSLLFDCVRVLARCLKRVPPCAAVPYTNHTRRAKRRFVAIGNAGTMKKRVPLYRDLLKVGKKTLGSAKSAILLLKTCFSEDVLAAGKLYSTLVETAELTERVIAQTERRVINGESVPVAEKVVSIFEPHTDIIRKARRETLYGHKLCLTAGASGLVLDCVIEQGNPADSNLATKMVERQIELYGRAPRQTAFDGGFSSKDNVADIKKLGVEDVAFSKAPGIALTDMVKSTWVYRRLKHFRAGIESVISFLKRSFGWDRCTWRSFDSFKAYCWSSVVAANLLTIARHSLN